MATKLSIWNRALQIMGSEKLVDAETNNKRSRALETAYEPCRDALLEEFPWGFAKKFLTLTYDATYSPQHTYSYQYVLPSDYISIVRIATTMPYEEIATVAAPDSSPSLTSIGTNDSGPLEVAYISRIENEAVFSPLFSELLAHRLAMACVEEITQSNTKKADVAEALRIMERKAKLASSKRRTPETMQSGSWFEAGGFSE